MSENEINLIKDDETLDDLLRGRLRIIQKKQGYRFSLDAVLLAHFARVQPGEMVFDLGTGSGVIPLILSGTIYPVRITAVEIQEELADMAARSVELNRLGDKIEIVRADVSRMRTLFPPCSCEVVTFNPPYRKLKSGRLNPNSQKAIARHEISGSITLFLSAASWLLKPRGRCYLIYKIQRLPELFAAMGESGIEPKRMRLVYSKPGSDAEFVLMEGSKEGGEEMRVLPPLTIYEQDGEYSTEMKSIFDELASSRAGGAVSNP